MEQNGDQCCGIDLDLLGEVCERCTLADTDNLAVSARNLNTTNDGCILLFELLTFCALRLASALTATASATECARS